MPVVKPIPARLTEDCVPEWTVPAGKLTVDDVVMRLASVEVALAKCRAQLSELRAADSH